MNTIYNILPALSKIPSWLQVFNKDICWSIPQSDKVVYLTFDDGPHPIATPMVLNLLNQFKCKATFFCVGNKVKNHNDIYQRIIAEGHAVGNHSYSHRSGWTMNPEDYVADVAKAAKSIHSTLFRPPYGRITPAQFKLLKGQFKVVMWDVLSKDYDKDVSNEKVIENVMQNISNGSIIVMHDNDKTMNRIEEILTQLLVSLNNEGWTCKSL